MTREYKFPTMLKRLIKRKGISNKQFADDMKIGITSLYSWRIGGATPTVFMMMDIADYFGVSMDYLLYGEE